MNAIHKILSRLTPFGSPQLDNRPRGPLVTLITTLLGILAVGLAVIGMMHWVNG